MEQTTMPKTVSANEAKNRLGSMLGYVSEENDEIIVESHGKPKAVIMSISAYEDVQALREKQRRADILERLRTFEARVGERNQDLTAEQVMELADRFAHEMIDDLAAEGRLVFERDQR
jgi:prevent-host-death family protein